MYTCKIKLITSEEVNKEVSKKSGSFLMSGIFQSKQVEWFYAEYIIK